MATTDCPTCHQPVRVCYPSARGSVPINGDPVYAWHQKQHRGSLDPRAGLCPGSRTTVAADALERAI